MTASEPFSGVVNRSESAIAGVSFVVQVDAVVWRVFILGSVPTLPVFLIHGHCLQIIILKYDVIMWRRRAAPFLVGNIQYISYVLVSSIPSTGVNPKGKTGKVATRRHADGYPNI